MNPNTPLFGIFLVGPLLFGPDPPRELGRVAWERDLERALGDEHAHGKPTFLLFQEIPGCATCQDFGDGPLTHPLMVEAIEELFVPVAVYSNRDGRDREWLERFEEPAWNKPVVRFLDANGHDLIPRRDRVWTTDALAGRMVRALAAADRPVPAWFALLAGELSAAPTETAAFAMHCYWSGEAFFGALDGVVGTRAALHAGREVVEVRFRPDTLAWLDLVRRADAAGFAARVHTTTPAQLRVARALVGERARPLDGEPRSASASDQTYHLGRSLLRHLPLTELQARRVNSALGTRTSPTPWLSPRQRALLRRVEDVAARAPRSFDELETSGADAADLASRQRALEDVLRAAGDARPAAGGAQVASPPGSN